MIIALGEKVFGALLAIAGTVIILSGHWVTPDDMIGDLLAGGIMVAMGVLVLLMWGISALHTAPVGRQPRRCGFPSTSPSCRTPTKQA